MFNNSKADPQFMLDCWKKEYPYKFYESNNIEVLHAINPILLYAKFTNGDIEIFNWWNKQSRRIMYDEYLTLDNYIQEFSIRLNIYMDFEGISGKQLSELTKLSTTTISQYRNGDRIPSLDILYRLAKALDCEISDFIFQYY